MHQDQRIGLALGVLLVGACAALFFRNDNRVAHQTPRLERAKELDDRIAEKSTRPYLKGIEVVEAADRKRAVPESPVQLNWWNSVDPMNTRPSTEVAKSQPIQPEPTSPVEQKSQPDLTSSIASTDPGPTIVEDSNSDHADAQLDATVPTERTHVVQRGETLTSIAAKTLGNPNRFPEIFDMNQDQLTDPNDVKLGMTLRIPNPNPQEPATNTASAAGTTDSPPPDRSPRREMISSLPKEASRNGDPTPRTPDSHRDDVLEENADGAQRRFTPSRRLPLPGRVAEPKLDGPKTNSGRRLSQLLPDDVNGKIAR